MININSIEDRIDARYYWFRNQLEKMTFKKVKLGNYIDVYSKQVHPKTESPNDIFSLVSVTNRHGIILDEDDEKKFQVKGCDIKNARVIHKGDIAFNPYRINVGSIGIAGPNLTGCSSAPHTSYSRQRTDSTRKYCAQF